MEAYLMTRNWRIFGLYRLMSNICMPRKGKQTEFCFAMIEALSAGLNNNEEQSRQKLLFAESHLKNLRQLKSDSSGRPFNQWWFEIRSEYTEINKVVI